MKSYIDILTEASSSVKMIVFHGGPESLVGQRLRAPIFVTPDIELARAYARERSRDAGVVTAFTLCPKYLGSEINIEHAAENAGIDEDEMREYRPWELVSPTVCRHAYAVIRELEALGCDAVSFGDTMPDAQTDASYYEAIVVLDPYILTSPRIAE